MHDHEILDSIVRSALESQYHSALAMLKQAIELCPEDLWAAEATEATAPYWRVAYHALYYTHLYLQPNEASFRPWEHHQTSLQDLDDIPAPPHLIQFLELPERPPQTGLPLTRDELLAYWTLCDGMVDKAVEGCDLLARVSGFSWHVPPRPKVELHVAAIRHIQHHSSQLAARLREATGEGVEWVGSRHG